MVKLITRLGILVEFHVPGFFSVAIVMNCFGALMNFKMFERIGAQSK